MSGRIARLANARLRISTSFDSACDITRNEETILTGVPCTVEDPDDYNQRVDGANVPTYGYMVGLPVTVDIQAGDHLIERGRILEVLPSVVPKSYEARRDVMCVQIGYV